MAQGYFVASFFSWAIKLSILHFFRISPRTWVSKILKKDEIARFTTPSLCANLLILYLGFQRHPDWDTLMEGCSFPLQKGRIGSSDMCRMLEMVFIHVDYKSGQQGREIVVVKKDYACSSPDEKKGF